MALSHAALRRSAAISQDRQRAPPQGRLELRAQSQPDALAAARAAQQPDRLCARYSNLIVINPASKSSNRLMFFFSVINRPDHHGWRWIAGHEERHHDPLLCGESRHGRQGLLQH